MAEKTKQRILIIEDEKNLEPYGIYQNNSWIGTAYFTVKSKVVEENRIYYIHCDIHKKEAYKGDKSYKNV